MNPLELIRSGDSNKAFKKLYKSFPQVRKYIVANSGTKMEAEDIFQQALYIFYEKAASAEFVLTTTAEGYVYSVARLLWKAELRKAKRQGAKADADDLELSFEDNLEEVLEKEARLKQIEQVFERIGESCKKILSLFYYKSLSMQEIAVEMNYSSVKATKTRKYKCLEKVRKMVQR